MLSSRALKAKRCIGIMSGIGSKSEITQYFENRSVFLTGGTGFVGKALTEKLLRACPTIKNIYLLMRPKFNVGVQDRIKNLTDNSVFDIVRVQNPDALKKLIPIVGEVTSHNLGISKEDEEVLCEHVSVVIHSAATIKFNEPMSLSANINVGGVQRVLELCKKIKQISAIIHLSTAYSNCENKDIREVVYPVPVDPIIALKTFTWLDDNVLGKITTELIGKKPNTYTYTKSFGEQLVQSTRGDLPICILRPSIVTAAVKEPMPGWVDCMQSGSGLMIAHGKGILGTTVADENCVIDYFPVDYLVNLIITAAWDLGTSKPSSSAGVTVYNCCSGQWNPVHQWEIQKYANEGFLRTPFNNLYRYPSMNLTRNHRLSKLYNYFVVYLPCLIADMLAVIKRQKPVMLKLYEKVEAGDKALHLFRTNEWNFSTENMKKLMNRMSAQDRLIFNFNVADINWQNYLHQYIHGLRKYTLKEDDSTLEGARQRLKRIILIHSWIRILSFVVMAGILASILTPWITC